jgi:hypothetical protein
MRRLLLAGGLTLALAGAGSAQSVTPQDDGPSPAEILSNLSKPLQAPEAPQGGKPGVKTDAAKKPEASARPEAARKSDAAAAKPGAPKSTTNSAADSLEQCLHDWDAATHMTRPEWARTCRRVVANRTRFLREQQGK